MASSKRAKRGRRRHRKPSGISGDTVSGTADLTAAGGEQGFKIRQLVASILLPKLEAIDAMFREGLVLIDRLLNQEKHKEAAIERVTARMDEITRIREAALLDGGLPVEELEKLLDENRALADRRRRLLGIKTV